MKKITIFYLTLFACLSMAFDSSISWLGDFQNATEIAAKSHKLILINFSGSDWCGPCIRLRKEILESDTFENFAKGNLVLVRADFPRQKKNQLTAGQTKKNEKLADKYNPDGKFPYTLLVSENGKILKTWDGFPNEPANSFIGEISAYLHSSN